MQNARASYEEGFISYVRIGMQLAKLSNPVGTVALVLDINYMQESGRHFKGKIMSKLMTYRAGNDARDFFKNVDAPLESGTGYLIVICFYLRFLL